MPTSPRLWDLAQGAGDPATFGNALVNLYKAQGGDKRMFGRVVGVTGFTLADLALALRDDAPPRASVDVRVLLGLKSARADDRFDAYWQDKDTWGVLQTLADATRNLAAA